MQHARILLDTSSSSSSSGGAITFVLFLAIAVLLIAAEWRIFSKAGQPGWAAIIPIYNMIVLLRVCQRPLWWFILLLIPFVDIIIAIILVFDLARVFGRSALFGLGLLFLSVIFYPILGFGDSRYVGRAYA